MQTVDDLAAFEQRLEQALAADHQCPCEVCHERQSELCWLTVLVWLGVGQADQMASLDAHPEDTARGAAVRARLLLPDRV